MPVLVSAQLMHCRPAATHLLARAGVQARTTLGPDRREAARRSIGAVTGDHVSTGAASRDAWSMFTDQFVLDVTGLRGQPMVFQEMAPADWKVLVTALYIEECSARLGVMSRAMLEGDVVPLTEDAAAEGPADLRALWHAYQDSVMSGRALDPLVTEAVRLRCARTHGCRICSTLRLAEARFAGADVAFTDQIDLYERSNLPDRVKVALRITDAFIIRPDLLDPDVVTQARDTFSEEELVELLLDISKWSTQKVNVATGTDGIDAIELNDEGVAFLSFDADGHTLPHSTSVTS
jgi:alkylhydroperoxidase family enzyme